MLELVVLSSFRYKYFCSIAATHGDVDTVEQLVTLYRNTTHMEEKRRVLSFLGASDKEECIEEALRFSMTVSIFVYREYFSLLHKVSIK